MFADNLVLAVVIALILVSGCAATWISLRAKKNASAAHVAAIFARITLLGAVALFGLL